MTYFRKIKTVLAFTSLFFLAENVRAEELLTFGLADLVYHSTDIFLGKPLAGVEFELRSHRGSSKCRQFLVLEVFRSDSLKTGDTIAVDIDGYVFEAFDCCFFYGYYRPVIETDYDRPVFSPTTSGIRPFVGDAAYIPYQGSDTNQPYYFQKAGQQSPSIFIEKTKRAVTRQDSVFALRKIEPAKEQNRVIFEWINAHRTAIKNSEINAPLDDENACGMFLHWAVFEWINGNGIWQDAWKSIQLSGEINPQDRVFNRPQDTPNAFFNAEARAFLMDEMTRPGGDWESPAIVLHDCLWDYEDEKNSIDPAEQAWIMQLARPLFADEKRR